MLSSYLNLTVKGVINSNPGSIKNVNNIKQQKHENFNLPVPL